jgi:hypothetical protein
MAEMSLSIIAVSASGLWWRRWGGDRAHVAREEDQEADYEEENPGKFG